LVALNVSYVCVTGQGGLETQQTRASRNGFLKCKYRQKLRVKCGLD
jgi:hypothetical protein